MTCELGKVPKRGMELAQRSVFVVDCEKLLTYSLARLKRYPDSLAAREIVRVFYTHNELLELVPRGAHTEMLLLPGFLSGWCMLRPGEGELSEPAVCKRDFERYLPVVVDWLNSMSGYLTEAEHFFEPVTGGRLKFSLKLGEFFLDLASSVYSLWVDVPSLEEKFEGKLLQEYGVVRYPRGCPSVLRNILRKVNSSLIEGEIKEAVMALRCALEFLLRYCAGVASVLAGNSEAEIVEAGFDSSSSITLQECESRLMRLLETGDDEDPIAARFRKVFFYRDDFGELSQPSGIHARILKATVEGSMRGEGIASFCYGGESSDKAVGIRENKLLLDRFLPVLRDWLVNLDRFWCECEHFEEVSLEESTIELVVQCGERYLELIGPEYVLPLPAGYEEMVGGEDLEDDDLVVSVPEVEQDEEEAWEHEEVTEEQAEEERRPGDPFMKYRIDYVGLQKNSKGKMCLSGYIRIENAGGGVLSGTAVTTHPSLEVSPATFEGNKVRLTYWVDEDSLPQNFKAFILLKSKDEERQIEVWEMQPKGFWKELHHTSARIAMWAPVVIGIGLFSLLFFPLASHIDSVLRSAAGNNWPHINLAKEAKGALVQVYPLTQLIGWCFLSLAGAVPLGVAKVFTRFNPVVKDMLAGERLRPMLSVSAIIFLGLLLPVFRTPVTTSPYLPNCNFYDLFFPWFVGLNVFASAYLSLSLSERIDDWIHDPYLRHILPAVLVFGYVCLVMLALNG